MERSSSSFQTESAMNIILISIACCYASIVVILLTLFDLHHLRLLILFLVFLFLFYLFTYFILVFDINRFNYIFLLFEHIRLVYI